MGLIRWQSAVDFLVLTVAIYLLLRWSREARALRFSLSIVALRVAAVLAAQLGLPITGWVLDGATIVAFLSLVVVFQPELRRALMRLDFYHGRAQQRGGTPVVSAVSAAAWGLARDRCGALIVIVRRDAIAELVTTGVAVGGRVSREILEAVFQKGGPVHDGATIIEGDVLLHVGAVLPLTQRTDVPAQFGTRHRAAMGLAERSDAVVVVVSEERGEVTVMSGTSVHLIDSEAELEATLAALTTPRERTASSPLRALRPADLKLQGAALGLSALVWSLTFLFPGSSVRVRTVPVELTNVPAGMSIASQSADTVDVWLRGSDFVFASVNLEALVARCDLKSAHEGVNAIRVQPSLELPLGIRVEGIAPREVNVRLTGTAPPHPAR